jgi:heme a synthase
MQNPTHTNVAAMPRASLRFYRLGITTIVAVYLLVLAGGIVRSTGSGMGCPDWPKCFGSWVPPTEASQLPPFYQTTFANKRQQKNEKLAGYLDKMGLSELATRIRHELNGAAEATFNPLKTWIEYINRLLGVIVGGLIFLMLVSSVSYLKTDRSIFYLTLSTFVLVGLQGWIGSVVVSTNLLPGIITVHMLLAIAILFLLIFIVSKASNTGKHNESSVAKHPFIRRIVVMALLTSLVQVLMGTQVRESIDHVIRQMGYEGRDNWISSLGLAFYIHRSFSLLILGVHGYLIYQMQKLVVSKGRLFKWVIVLAGLVGAELITGIAMAYLGVPALLQPVHLTLALLVLGIQFDVFLLLNKEVNFAKVASRPISVVGAQAVS